MTKFVEFSLLAFCMSVWVLSTDAHHPVNPVIPAHFEHVEKFSATGREVTHWNGRVTESSSGGTITVGATNHTGNPRILASAGIPGNVTIQFSSISKLDQTGHLISAVNGTDFEEGIVGFCQAYQNRINHVNTVRHHSEMYVTGADNYMIQLYTDTVEAAGFSHLTFGGVVNYQYLPLVGDVTFGVTLVNLGCDKGRNVTAVEVVLKVAAPEIHNYFGLPSNVSSSGGYFAASPHVLLDGNQTVMVTGFPRLEATNNTHVALLRLRVPTFKHSVSFHFVVCAQKLGDVLSVLGTPQPPTSQSPAFRAWNTFVVIVALTLAWKSLV